MTPRLNLVRRLLHWTVALIVVFMVPGGLFFTDFDNKPVIEAVFGIGSFNDFYSMHKSVGVLVLALMAMRVGAKFAWPAPAYQPRLPLLDRVAATATHVAMYLLLLAVPVLGYLGTSTFPAPVPVFGLFEIPPLLEPDRAFSATMLFWHRMSVFALSAIVVVHVCAALWHRNVKHDGVFERIALIKRSGSRAK
jgi:cytochrome b561